jgi:hypothetical protein
MSHGADRPLPNIRPGYAAQGSRLIIVLKIYKNGAPESRARFQLSF